MKACTGSGESEKSFEPAPINRKRRPSEQDLPPQSKLLKGEGDCVVGGGGEGGVESIERNKEKNFIFKRRSRERSKVVGRRVPFRKYQKLRGKNGWLKKERKQSILLAITASGRGRTNIEGA